MKTQLAVKIGAFSKVGAGIKVAVTLMSRKHRQTADIILLMDDKRNIVPPNIQARVSANLRLRRSFFSHLSKVRYAELTSTIRQTFREQIENIFNYTLSDQVTKITTGNEFSITFDLV